MSRQDWELIAEVLCSEFEDWRKSSPHATEGERAVTDLTFALADKFDESYSNFDKVRFLNAANPN